MSRETVVKDDIDGTYGAESVSFAYDGVQYEIDLSPENKKFFDNLMAPYVDVARKAGPAEVAESTGGGKVTHRKGILAFQRATGRKITRIPDAECLAAYDAAVARPAGTSGSYEPSSGRYIDAN